MALHTYTGDEYIDELPSTLNQNFGYLNEDVPREVVDAQMVAEAVQGVGNLPSGGNMLDAILQASENATKVQDLKNQVDSKHAEVKSLAQDTQRLRDEVAGIIDFATDIPLSIVNGKLCITYGG